MLLSVAVSRPHFVIDGWTTQKHPGDVRRRRDAPRFERDRRALGRPRARAVCVGRDGVPRPTGAQDAPLLAHESQSVILQLC